MSKEPRAVGERVRRNLFVVAEGWLRVEFILYAFWAMFWLLNGLDKFFNGEPVRDLAGKGYLGWFGVNRDAKMIAYFSRLHLPDWLAIGTLYSFAIIELVIGLMFLAVLLKKDLPKTVHRMAFKLSFFVFFAFMAGDILFGDRMELWEHGTFMVLTLMTFNLYIDRAKIRGEIVGHQLMALDPERSGVSTVEYESFLLQQRIQQDILEQDGVIDTERYDAFLFEQKLLEEMRTVEHGSLPDFSAVESEKVQVDLDARLTTLQQRREAIEHKIQEHLKTLEQRKKGGGS